MALEERPVDDQGILKERIVKASKSSELFRTILDDLLEDESVQIRDEANYILGKLQSGEVGVICDDEVSVGDELSGTEIVVTQLLLGDKFVPVFVISPSLNEADLFEHFSKPSFMDIKPSREHMKPVVKKAVSTMAFALRAAEKYNTMND